MHHSHSNKGSALMLVLIILSVFAILGTALLSLSLSENKQVIYQERRIKAQYSARSGAEAMASYLIENPGQATTVISKDFYGPFVNNHKAIIKVIDTDSSDEVVPVIISEVTETVGGYTKLLASVKLSLFNSQSNLLDYAVFSNKSPHIGKNFKGNVGTNGKDITRSGGNPSAIEGNLSVYNGGTPSLTQDEIDDLKDQLASDSLELRNEIIGIPPIDTSLFDSVAILTGDTLTVSSAEAPKWYKISSVNSGFVLDGGGTAHILVTDDSWSINKDILAKDGSRLFLYSLSDQTLSVNGSKDISSGVVIYAPEATINMNGSGNAEIEAVFICDQYLAGSSRASETSIYNFKMSDLGVTNAIQYSRGVYEQ